KRSRVSCDLNGIDDARAIEFTMEKPLLVAGSFRRSDIPIIAGKYSERHHFSSRKGIDPLRIGSYKFQEFRAADGNRRRERMKKPGILKRRIQPGYRPSAIHSA